MAIPAEQSVYSARHSISGRAVAALAAVGFAFTALPALAQPDNAASLRFFGTGVGPPGQQDRVRIPIDDNAPGPDASTPADLGAGSFTIDLWVRGRLADNNTPAGPAGEFFDFRWIEGNIIVDRDIFGASAQDWGVSLAGGRIRFGTGFADSAPNDVEHTLQGSVNVLNDQWRHIAVVRDASDGRKLIYVDGVLDAASPPGRSTDDISYPNSGDPAPVTPWGPFIVLAAEKHDAGAEYPSFRGRLDEVRLWSRALSASEIAAWRARVLPPDAAGLVAAYRFEEGAGVVVTSSTPNGAPAGQLIAGVPGNGEWSPAAADPANVAPLWCGPADITADGVSDLADFFDFLNCFDSTDPCADINADTAVDLVDFFEYLNAFDAGC